MRPTELLQDIRKIRFEETYSFWTERRLNQQEAARILGVSGNRVVRADSSFGSILPHPLHFLSLGMD